MENKRGFSQVVTTIIIVAIALVIIATFAVILNEFLKDESSKIKISQITTELKIESASVDTENETIILKIIKEKGSEEISNIKIIIEDDQNALSFDREVAPMREFDRRILTIILKDSIINSSNIKKITVFPIIPSSSGMILGNEFSLEGKRISEVNFEENSEEEGEETIMECVIASDCGANRYLDLPYCSTDKTKIMQYEKVFKCEQGYCLENNYERTIEICLKNSFCQNAECIEFIGQCTPETIPQDCGEDRYIRVKECDGTKTKILQNYLEYTCVLEECVETEYLRTVEECTEDFPTCELISGEAECIRKIECTKDTQKQDCQIGEICQDGKCINEEKINSGIIYSIWPFNAGEYFDSEDLSKGGTNYKDFLIIFPGSEETRCISIINHIFPTKPEENAYLRLGYNETNIQPGDYYEIWETTYICSQI